MDTSFTSEQKKILFLTGLGGALEFYDFIIFVFFAKTLGTLFFPSTDPFASLMASWAFVAVGYLARPLGGMILGHLGDRFGRKRSFIITLIGMAVPSFFIGLLPSYQTIGVYAPILLVICRLCQGFFMGGELPGALVFITELTPQNKRAWVCSLIFLGVNAGSLLGSFLSTWILHHFSVEGLLAWGWRIPFLFGGVLGVIGFYLRRRLNETPFFITLQQQQKQASFPLKEVLTCYYPEVVQGLILTSLGAVIVSLCLFFMPTYLNTFFHYPLDKLMFINTSLILFFAICPLIIGQWADRWSYLNILRLGALGLFLFSYLFYTAFGYHSLTLTIFSLIGLTVISSLVISVFTSLLVSLYPTAIRYSGVAFVYNVGFAFAGGLTPLAVTWLIRISGNPLIPGLYLMLFAGLALFTSFFMRETRGTTLNNPI